ncbi:MAG: thioredoxin family protein [Candidatus Sabulitectum sp.]|nr:thioredoxin family protein [Candidatus Sabulitectum sp.]
MKAVIVVSVCLLAVIAILAGKNHESGNASVADVDPNLPRLLDLGSHNCSPCRMMVPELAAVSENYSGVVQVEFIDVNERPDAAQSYGIKLIPTQIIFDAAGNELFRHEGYMSREDMTAELTELGFSPSSSPSEE